MKRNAFNCRILVVDDSDPIHEDFQRILRGPTAHAPEELAALESELFGDDDFGDGEIEFQVDHVLQGEEGWRRVRDARAQNAP